MKLGIAVSIGALLGGCAGTKLSAEDAKTRNDYIVDEQACVAKAVTKAEGYDCLCAVASKQGRPCPLPRKDGGT